MTTNMKDLTDNELKKLIEQASQEWADRCKQKPSMLDAKFPRGYIRPLKEICSRWPYLSYDSRRAVGSTIQLADVNRWFINTWQVSLTAGTEWDWQSSIPIIATMEMLLYSYGIKNKIFESRISFEKMINLFFNERIINESLRKQLQEQRKRRNDIHLYLKGNIENHNKKPIKYNSAVRTLLALEKSIMNHYESVQQNNSE